RDDVLLDGVAADFAREAAVAARVRHRRGRHLGAAVRRRRHVILFHEQPHFFLLHAEADDLGPAFARDLERDVEHVALLLGRDAGQVLALPFALGREAGDTDRFAALAAFELVGDRLDHARTDLRIIEPGNEVLRRAFAVF